jgi:fructoselysine-6-P-deglycase FrlB-like protein
MSSLTAAELATQPAVWRRAATLAEPSDTVLPQPGERVAVVGCGTSWFMAQAYAALREAAGQGETDAFAASEFRYARRYDRVLAISRSGTTTEVLDLLGRLSGRTPSTALTADPATPVKQAAGRLVVLDFADERSVVQTRFATGALALLRAHLELHGTLPPGVHSVTEAAADAERALAQPLPEDLLAVDQISFLGAGWTNGLALEAGLKMREAARFWTESYPAMEYRHGPIAITGPRRAVWMFGALPVGLDAQIAATGGLLVADSAPSGLDPMADLVRVHRLAVALAEARGMDPDRPQALTRSVML